MSGRTAAIGCATVRTGVLVASMLGRWSAHLAAQPKRDSVEARASFAGAGPATSLRPVGAPRPGQLAVAGDWTLMLHGDATLNVRRDRGPRGDDATFHTGSLMVMATRRLEPGWLRAELMLSAEPVMGPEGYPLLLQTGESADGLTSLLDRQHPHDAIMALGASYRVEIEGGAWLFLYAAPVGSPALGPVPYMHRSSGMVHPTAPISHHFLDATHISYGVVTAGLRNRLIQAEASAFNGLEPDRRRWRPDRLRLDSFSVRVTVTPGRHWAFQASFGDLATPERLHPVNDVRRATVSATHARMWGDLFWTTTVAWGRNDRREVRLSLGEARARLPQPILDHYLGTASLPPGADDSLLLRIPRRIQTAVLLESALRWRRSTLFARAETASKDELIPLPDLRHSTTYDVAKIQLGASQGVAIPRTPLTLELGAAVDLHRLPDALAGEYGAEPRAVQFFARASL